MRKSFLQRSQSKIWFGWDELWSGCSSALEELTLDKEFYSQCSDARTHMQIWKYITMCTNKKRTLSSLVVCAQHRCCLGSASFSPCSPWLWIKSGNCPHSKSLHIHLSSIFLCKMELRRWLTSKSDIHSTNILLYAF